MDDPQRKPGDRDRSELAARIESAAAQGRIGTADRDIRLANVASAQTMAELDLMRRDLDQLEATLQSAVRSTAPALPQQWTGATRAPLADQITDAAVGAAKTGARSVGLVIALAVVLVLVLAGAGASAFVVFRSSGEHGSVSGGLFAPEPIPSDMTVGPGDEPAADPTNGQSSANTAYALTTAGIRSLVAGYRAKFDTTLVVDLVMYDEYVIVQVPQAGRKRHVGFLYRRGEGWQDFGGVQANSPGAQPVDLRRLDLHALVLNIARARRTLNVEDVSQTYVIVHDYSPADEGPSVDIHVSNEYGESGYLATDLDGAVERAYPYAG